MTRLILLPQLVEGEQWFPNKKMVNVIDNEHSGEAKTVHGSLTVLAGDWIIKNRNEEIIDICHPSKLLEYYEVFNGDKDL